jgi:hypothetical protein
VKILPPNIIYLEAEFSLFFNHEYYPYRFNAQNIVIDGPTNTTCTRRILAITYTPIAFWQRWGATFWYFLYGLHYQITQGIGDELNTFFIEMAALQFDDPRSGLG